MLTFSTIVLALITTTTEIRLSHEQQIAVLQEAQIAYDHAVELQTADPVAAKESFRRAANRFQVLVDDGIENGKLWYDLGNAQLQVGEIGEAIAAYRSASRYIPSDGRVETNLEYARSLVTNRIDGENSTSLLNRLAFWHESLPTSVRLTLGITFWFACWTLVSIRLFRVIPLFKTASVSFGLFALALGVSVGADIADQHQDHGVLTTKEVIVRKGSGEQYGPMFNEPLHEGTEFEVLGQHQMWLHIRLPNGNEGWIGREDAQIVKRSDSHPLVTVTKG